MTQAKRLLAIDPSLTCSGWALFRIKDDRLLAIGKVRSLPSEIALHRRLSDLQEKIHAIYEAISLCADDVLICEAPTTMRDPRAAFKVEQVRGIFETLARTRTVSIPGRINPRSVHHEVLGLSGRQLPRTEVKKVAVAVARQLFSDSFRGLGFDPTAKNLTRHQDIVDAVLIGYLGLSKLKTANFAGEDLGDLWSRRSLRRVV